MLNILNVSKSYATPQGLLPVLNNISLNAERGQSIALMGESGSGKSTLLHLIAGLDNVDTGSIFLNQKEITKLPDVGRAKMRRSEVGLVFQQFNLIPSLKIKDNLAFQARIAKRFDQAWQSELIERLGLGSLLDRYPEQLSGGQQQRVAIGRAFAGKPDLLLADEPTGNLDEAAANEVLKLAIDLVEKTDCCFLMVTHSAHLASFLNTKITLKSGHLA
ncbi:MAG: ABC transporter ATP-binding protein [Sneathiella sp.]